MSTDPAARGSGEAEAAKATAKAAKAAKVDEIFRFMGAKPFE